MSGFGHGSVGTREQAFTNLLHLRKEDYPTHQLVQLAKNIKGAVDTVKDGPDPEENLWVSAGYTYFGQFIDHDLTFDNTSSLNPADDGEEDRLPTNLRTPRFDLDSLYGDGPDAQPFLYAEDGASLLFKDSNQSQSQTTYEQATQDLLRSPNGRAIIGDKRNDENSIISQIQLAFVKYHNAVVKKISKDDETLTGTALFNQARNEVRWTYQKLVIEDFLPRIVKAEVFADLQEATTPKERKNLYALYTHHKRQNLPREFVVAAYRFGHSGVRTGYRLNKETSLTIFPSSEDPKPDNDSLLGFEPLPKAHVIDDWSRFFPNTQPGVFTHEDRSKAADDTINTEVRLQFAYKIDTTLVDPLGVLPPKVLPTSATVGGLVKEVEDTIGPKDTLTDEVAHPPRPSLALLNLLRGNTYKVQGGQAIAHALQRKKFPVEVLEPKYLSTRQPAEDKDKFFQFEQIDSSLQRDTPLWFYILAEAQASVVDAIELEADGTFNEKQLLKGDGAKTQLGWVGGRIIAEVFYGLLDSDRESYFNGVPEGWKPILGGNGEVIFANLLKFAGLTVGN
ncbi:peroxidase family protein [Nostoc sp.]|uniref:peroxidase family protein n=1 Tax=Nostoc sp. TaxID=1180 RepID=UPI002FF8BB92